MNATFLCLVSALTAPPADPAIPSVSSPSPRFERVVRAQSPDPFYQSMPVYAQGPTLGGPVQPGIPLQTAPPPTFSPGMVVPDGGIPGGSPVPNYAPVLPPSQPSAPFSTDPFTSDPFMGGSENVVPLTQVSDPPGLLPVSYSINGLQPYRFGVTHRLNFGMLPVMDTERDKNYGSQLGNLGIFEFDYAGEYTFPIFDRSIFSYTFQYGLRSWNGPNNASPINAGNLYQNAIDLPGSLHHFGTDFELTTPVDNPVVYQVGFNPSINTDFNSSLSSTAWNLDARAVMFHRVSPQTTLVGGVLYWDRVDDIILPYIGVIRRPSPRREYILVFPNPRISFLISDGGGIAKWAYLRGEYHVESYQIQRQPIRFAGVDHPYNDQIQYRDWRVLGGLRTVNPYGVSAFFEAGVVFSREVQFLRGTPAFDVNPGFIGRAGLQF